MDDRELERRIDAIVDALADNARVALELADEADRVIVRQPDPTLYGFLCFYRFKAAYELGAWERAWSVLPPRFTFTVTPMNAAWMFSAKAEIAARLGKLEELRALAARSIGIRREMGDVKAMLAAARTACELLHELGRDDLNTDFLPIILGESRFYGEDELTAYGYATLVRNIIATENPICIDVLLDGREWLARCADDNARKALEFVHSSPLVRARVVRRQTARLLTPPFDEVTEKAITHN